MSSIHRDRNKPNWFCQYYDPEGFRRNRSTGTENAKVAKAICATVDRAASLARDNKLSNEKGLKLIRDTCTAIEETHGKLEANRAHDILKSFIEEFIKIAGGEFTSYTVRSWLESWIAGRTDASKATVIEYRRVIELFLRYLGTRADRALTTLQPRQIEDFKIKLTERVAPSTVNKGVKVLKAAFNAAVRNRQLEFNPAEHVEFIQVEQGGRRPFKDDELKKLLSVANDEWRTMILLGYYTGLRLGDCANLTWLKIELHKSIINIQTEKTGRRQILPIAEPLNRQFQKLAGDNPEAPLCPSLSGKKTSRLSAQFYDLMVGAGLAKKRGHETTGKGRDSKRDMSKISFHSLRYNTTSALKSSGVSDSVAMDIVGHETASVSRNYTKIDEDAKRAAINKLPDITK